VTTTSAVGNFQVGGFGEQGGNSTAASAYQVQSTVNGFGGNQSSSMDHQQRDNSYSRGPAGQTQWSAEQW